MGPVSYSTHTHNRHTPVYTALALQATGGTSISLQNVVFVIFRFVSSFVLSRKESKNDKGNCFIYCS